MIKMNEVIETIIWILYLIGTLAVGYLVIYWLFNLIVEDDIRRSNKCVENGGIVVTDSAGYFESCIRR